MADKLSEFELFKQEMKDVLRLKRSDQALIDKKAEVTPGHLVRRQSAQNETLKDDNFLTADHVEMLGPHDILEYRRDGCQHGVFKKLRMGRYPLDARLDLHRMTVEDARREVFQFIRDCYRHELRTLIILHGKGERNADKTAPIKSYVNKWLKEIDEVMAFHSAQKQHGGTGAVYVLLKKGERERQRNKERHGGK